MLGCKGVQKMCISDILLMSLMYIKKKLKLKTIYYSSMMVYNLNDKAILVFVV